MGEKANIEIRRDVLLYRRECSHCRKVEFDELIDIAERLKSNSIPGQDVWKVPYVVNISEIAGKGKCLECFLDDANKHGTVYSSKWKPEGDVSERWRIIRELEFLYDRRFDKRNVGMTPAEMLHWKAGFEECLEILKSMG